MSRPFCLPWASLLLAHPISWCASVTLTSPSGGDSWAALSAHWINWRASGLPAKATVALSYSTDGGRTWARIGEAPADRGRILWTVPLSLSKQCKVRAAAAGSEASHQGMFAITPSRAAAYRWTNVTMKAQWAPRDGAGALVFDGGMWLVGGWNPKDKRHFPRICNNDVWRSDNGGDWMLVKPGTFVDQSFDPAKDWEGRHTAGYAIFQNKMWIIGGDVNQGHYQNDVWNSADGAKWTLVNRNVPWGPRALHHTLAFRGKIWVMGGQTMPAFGKADEIFHRDVWNTDDGVRWNRVQPREPYWSARGMIGGNVVFRDRMWILGGGTYDTPKTPRRNFYNDVWSSGDGVSWTRHLESAPWEPRQYHDVAVFDGRMWVLEGYYQQAGGNLKDVWYSADGVNWYEVQDTPWKARHAASVFVYREALWMVAGNNMESDVWKLERIR